MKEHTPPHSGPQPGYEKRDVHVRAIVSVVAGVLLACAITMAMTGLFLEMIGRDHREASPPAAPSGFLPPRLQSDPAIDLAKLRTASMRELTTYGWIDRERGIVRIPIERAMTMLLERGLPETERGVTRLEMQRRKATETKEVPDAR